MDPGRDDLSGLFSDSLAPGAAPVSRTRPGRRLVARAGRRASTALLAGLAVAGGLLPLYGDPRVTPLTHPLWARMLLQGLDLEEAARPGARASEVFTALAWTESLSLPAAAYASGEGVRVDGEWVRASAGVGEVRYNLAVVRGGEYRLRCRLQGDPGSPVSAEVGPTSGGVLKGFELRPPAGGAAWVPAGGVHLDPGSYTASVLLPPGAALDHVEVAPPCVRPIQPPEGWQSKAVTTRDDLVVTLLQALDAESALPPGDLPIEIRASDVQVEGSILEAAMDPATLAPTIEDLRLEGGREGQRAVGFVEIPRAGLYTLYAFASAGDGLSFLADGCSKSVFCPVAGSGLAWRPVLSRRFEAGRHHVDITLGAGARIEGMRLELKRDDVGDYVTALRSLGFDPGPPGPVTGAAAAEAIRFLKRRRAEDPALKCGDVPLSPPPTVAAPPALVAGVPQPVQPGGGGGGVGPVDPGVTFPNVDPQEPASPVVPVGP